MSGYQPVRTAAGVGLMWRQPYNPMEDAYHYALRILDQSLHRELEMLHVWGYSGADDAFYRREHDIKSRYYSERERLEYDFRRASQRSYDYCSQYTNYDYLMYYSTPTYLLPKETTKVPTETKKYIIISSAGASISPKHYTTLAEAEKEATKLAKEYPESEFTIYATTKSFKVADKPVDVKVYV